VIERIGIVLVAKSLLLLTAACNAKGEYSSLDTASSTSPIQLTENRPLGAAGSDAVPPQGEYLQPFSMEAQRLSLAAQECSSGKIQGADRDGSTTNSAIAAFESCADEWNVAAAWVASEAQAQGLAYTAPAVLDAMRIVFLEDHEPQMERHARLRPVSERSPTALVR